MLGRVGFKQRNNETPAVPPPALLLMALMLLLMMLLLMMFILIVCSLTTTYSLCLPFKLLPSATVAFKVTLDSPNDFVVISAQKSGVKLKTSCRRLPPPAKHCKHNGPRPSPPPSASADVNDACTT